MNNNGIFRMMWAGVAVLSLLTLLAGCGGGGDSGAAPGVSGTITLAASAASMPADGSSSVVITATVKDGAGNPVRHYTDVNFSTTLGYFRNGGTSYTVQTLPPLVDGKPDIKAAPTGIAEVSLRAGTTAGAAKVTVTSNGVTQSVYVTLTGGSAGITLTAEPDTIPADGKSSTTVTATLTDAGGTAVKPGTQVTFTTGLGHFLSDLKSYTVSTPDSTGIVKVSLQSDVVPGTTYVQAASGNAAQALSIVMTKTDPLYGEITIEANPSRIPADGASKSLITATVNQTRNIATENFTASSQPISGIPITFYKITSNVKPQPLPDANTYIGTGTSIAGPFYSYGGLTTFYMTAVPEATIEEYFTVWLFNPLSGERVLLINRSDWGSTVTLIEEKGVSLLPGNYQLEIQTNCYYEIKVVGNIGPAQTGKTVLGFAVTGADGKAAYTYTADWLTGSFTVKAETGELSNSENALSAETTLTQTQSTPEPIEIAAASASIYANGETTTSITAQVWTDDGNKAPDGTVVNFSASSGTITASTKTVAGLASATLTSISSSTSIASTVTATVGANSASTTVTFLGVALTDMQAVPGNIFSNGKDTSEITVRIRDAKGLAVAGEPVTFATTLGSIQTEKVSTDSSGIAKTTLIAPTTPGTANITAVYGLITSTTTITFASPVPVGVLTLTADPDTLPADGKSSSTITAEIKDTSNAPVPKGTPVTFTTSLGTFAGGSTSLSVITPDATGKVSVSLIAAATPGSARVTASCAGVSQSIYVGFGGSAISILLKADPTTIPADGTSSSKITATLKDGKGDPVTAGTSVTFTTSLGKFSNGTATITTTTIGATGVATVALIAAKAAGSARVTATSLGVSQSIYVGFGGAPVKIVLTAEPDEIWADGVSSSAIQARLTDAGGAPVTPGTLVAFTTNLGRFANGLQSYTVPTPDNTGIVTVSLIAGTITGSAKVSASASGVEQSVYVEFIEKGGDPFSMILSADPTTIPADGTSSSKITATLKDSAGKPVKTGTSVTFSTTLGKFNNGAKVYTVTTPDATGVVAVTLIAGTTAGSASVSATSNGVTQTVYVTFTGAIVASINVSATPDTLLADGVSTSIIRAEVKDAQGNPIADGERITFTIISGGGTLSAASATTSGGFASVTYTAFTTPGDVVIRAMSSNNVSDTVSITLTSSAVGTIILTASPESIPANGTSSSAITATVRDGAGKPVTKGTSITFTTTIGKFSNGTATITVPTLDDTGTATVSLISAATPGTAVVTAASGGVSQTILVSFTGGVGSIILTANPTSIPADGTSSSSITAEVRDPSGNLVPAGTSVTFTTNLGKFTGGVTTITATTVGTTGKISVSLIAATTPGSARVTATADGITQSVYVGMGGVPVTIALTADPTSIPADGSSSSVITADVRDGDGNPVIAGTAVIFTTTLGTFSNGTNTITGYTGIDGQGKPTGRTSVSLTSATTEGVALVKATFNGVSQSVNVSFTGGVGTITLTASPASLPADGASSSAITAIVRDGTGNPVPKGTSVIFTTTLGKFSNGGASITVTTLADTGMATVSLIAASTPGTASVKASSGGVSQTTTVTFIGGGQPAKLILKASKLTVKSDNSDSATITATLLDGANAPIAGFVVAFSASTGQISASSATTDANGQAKITFSSGTDDSSNRTATITATVAGPGGLISESINIKILGSTLTLTTDKETIPDDRSDPATLTAIAKDGGGTPVENATISFTVTGTGSANAEVVPNVGITDATGMLKVKVEGTSSQGEVTVTANWDGTTASQTYSVTPALNTFAIVLPAVSPYSTETRSPAAITGPSNGIAFVHSNPDTITRSAGSFVTDGYMPGDRIMVGGSNSNDGVYTLSAVAPLTLTLIASDSLDIEPAGASVTITNGVLVRVRAPGITDVTFATTIGIWDNGGSPIKTNPVVSGYASAVLSSSVAGTATIQVYDSDNPSTFDFTTVTFSVPSGNAAQITLQSNVYMLAPSIGGTINTASLTATVRTSLADGSQVVSGVMVVFSIVNPTGGGETVSPVVTISDGAGQAKATFTSGSLSSGSEGVTVRAVVSLKEQTASNTSIAFLNSDPDTITRSDGVSFLNDGFEPGDQISVQGSASNNGYYTLAAVAPNTLTLVNADSLTPEAVGASVTITHVITNTANIVIGGTAGSVVIGRGTVIYDLDDATYRLPMAALVTDSNGNAVSGAVVTLSAWPLQYAPGVWYDSDPDPKAELYKVYYTGTFINNEDVNENLILDPGEDKDGDGRLTPASSSAGGVPVPSQVVTGANGVATFDLIYLKANARWIKTRIRARTFVVGTETTSSVEMVLPAEKQQAEKGLLPDSPFPIGLVTGATETEPYKFPVFYGAGDTFTTSGNLSAGTSQMIPTYDYEYDPDPGGTITPAEVGDIIWDYISVINTFWGAYFPVRIIIQ